MKKKNKIILLSFILLILFAGGVLLWKEMNNYSHVLRMNWKFSLPYSARLTEIYSQDSGPSFHGDGIRYHVFSYQNQEPIKEMCDWKTTQQRTIYYESYLEAVQEWLDGIDVPSNERPNCKECVFGYNFKEDNSEIIMLWDKSRYKLYIVESFL